jgi:hypothetical protein
MGEIKIGDMVQLTWRVKKSGKKTAISAWRNIRFHGNSKGYDGFIPNSSANYNDWFESLCNSVAVVVDNKVDGIAVYDWIKVHFLCSDEAFWTRRTYLRKCE